ncbi:acyl-CoA dehydrogenase, partial [Pseudomonas sp. CM25]|uniref:acyl-CoA dehydrogenase C-terminal domain-containing protein n=1 Tax=Pseudomonas sp. CM25 TaxID=2738448 RepID=UPI001556DF4B
VLGGHGYIREWGQEQLIRDCRITQIYEGTNGIQALDLVGRKLFGEGGKAYRSLSDEIVAYAEALPAQYAEFSAPLLAAVRNLDDLTAWLLDRGQGNPQELGAAAVEYLQVFGYTFYAYLWARMAVVCQDQAAAEPFHQSKLGTARFYFARLLPRIHSLSASVRAGSDSLYLLEGWQL